MQITTHEVEKVTDESDRNAPLATRENKGGTIRDASIDPVEAALARALDRARGDDAIMRIVAELEARRAR